MSPGEPSAWSLKSPRVGLPQSKEARHPFLPGSDGSMWGRPLPPDFTDVAIGWLAPAILVSSVNTWLLGWPQWPAPGLAHLSKSCPPDSEQ